MRITWYGQSAFRLDFGRHVVLIDLFLSGNPAWGRGWEGPAEGATHVLLTHGHDDHVGDALGILPATGAQLVACFELCRHLVRDGVDAARINPGNIGGTRRGWWCRRTASPSRRERRSALTARPGAI